MTVGDAPGQAPAGNPDDFLVYVSLAWRRKFGRHGDRTGLAADARTP